MKNGISSGPENTAIELLAVKMLTRYPSRTQNENF